MFVIARSWISVVNGKFRHFRGERRINNILVTRQILQWNKYWCKFRPIHNIHQIDWMWLTARVTMWSAREKNSNFGFVGVIELHFMATTDSISSTYTILHCIMLYYIIWARFILYGICVLAYTVNHARKKTQKE